MEKELKRTDWDKWRNTRRIPLWKAVCLSCDLEPDPDAWHDIYSSPAEDIFPRIQSVLRVHFCDNLLQSRFNTAANYIDAEGCFPIPHRPLSSPCTEWTVDLIAFGSWAQKNGLDIPDDFPREVNDIRKNLTHQSSPEDLQNASQLTDEKEILELLSESEEMRRVIAAMKTAKAAKITDTGGLKTCLENSFKGIGYPMPAVATEQLAIVIRPDEVAFKDKRSRKKPPRK